jgi:hypothetical protein
MASVLRKSGGDLGHPGGHFEERPVILRFDLVRDQNLNEKAPDPENEALIRMEP